MKSRAKVLQFSIKCLLCQSGPVCKHKFSLPIADGGSDEL